MKPELDQKQPPKRAWETYSDEEKKVYKKEMIFISEMRDNFRRALTEFDDKTYLQAYEENRRADLAYNTEVDESTDFRMTTGLTREKDTSILSTLISYNFQPNISAFKKDNTIISQLGNEMEDLVKKSREIEMYAEKRQSIYRELISQGLVYVEEVYKEYRILKPYETDWMPGMPIAEYKQDDKPLYDVEGKCEAKLHLGKYVMVSSMNEEEVQNNDAVALYEEVDWGVAQAIYGKWDRWSLVPQYVNNETPFKDGTTGNTGSDYIWNTYKVAKGKAGITKVMYRFENRVQIYINGVMMLPIGFPLTKLSPSGLYPIAKGIGERIPNFFCGKGIPAKTKVDQKMYDTVLRAMLGKMWQSFRPALGNRSGNVLSRDIVQANQMTHGIKQNDIFTILPQQMLAVSNGDISMFTLLKEIISEKSVTDSYAAQNSGPDTTATQIVNEKQQTMLKLTASIDGVKSLEMRLVLLRIYNIIANWTKYEESPLVEDTVEVVEGIAKVIGKNVHPTEKVKKYKKFTVDTALEDGTPSMKVTHFIGDDEPLPGIREQIHIEDKMQEEHGKPVRLSYINAEWLRLLQAIWNVEIIVASDGDDQMKLLLFMDNLTRIANLFGTQVFKQDYVLQRISTKMQEDFDKMFNLPQGADMATMMAQISGQPQQNQATTQIQNPAQQMMNSKKVQPMTAAKVV